MPLTHSLPWVGRWVFVRAHRPPTDMRPHVVRASIRLAHGVMHTTGDEQLCSTDSTALATDAGDGRGACVPVCTNKSGAHALLPSCHEVNESQVKESPPSSGDHVTSPIRSDAGTEVTSNTKTQIRNRSHPHPVPVVCSKNQGQPKAGWGHCSSETTRSPSRPDDRSSRAQDTP